MIDKYSESTRRPKNAPTRKQIMAEVNSDVQRALKMETDIRDKEKDLRTRMGEKTAIGKLTKQTSVSVDPSRVSRLLKDLKDTSSSYFKGPLTKNVNFRSVLEAHSNVLSKKEINQIIKLHNDACYEETYAQTMVNYCAELAMKGKVKEGFPV